MTRPAKSQLLATLELRNILRQGMSIVALNRFDHYEKFPALALRDCPANWYRIELK
jgi:hypothetical protein